MSLNNYIQKIKQYPLLPRKEEVNLARRAERGNEKALESLITSNLRLVVYYASKLYHSNSRIHYQDLISAGNEALIKAAKTYDWKKRVKFCTYAGNGIKWAMLKEIKNKTKGEICNLPSKIQKAIFKLQNGLGRMPTYEEIAEEVKEDVNYIYIALEMSKKPLSLEEAETFLESNTNYEDDEYLAQCKEPIHDYLDQYTNQILNAFDDLQLSPQKILRRKKMSEQINLALSKLNIKRKEIIMRNFGLGEYESQSLEDISKVLGVTRERVRALREKACSDLRKELYPLIRNF